MKAINLLKILAIATALVATSAQAMTRPAPKPKQTGTSVTKPACGLPMSKGVSRTAR